MAASRPPPNGVAGITRVKLQVSCLALTLSASINSSEVAVTFATTRKLRFHGMTTSLHFVR